MGAFDIDAPRLEITSCRSPAELEFVAALHARAERAGWYASNWARDDRLLITVDITDPDPQYNRVLRMLRVDFMGTTISLGPDRTLQLVGDLDPKDTGVAVLGDRAPRELAEAAADWLEREMRRPIERREWEGAEFSHRCWVLADEERSLAWQDSENRKRDHLGQPDRVTRVR